MPNVRKRFIEKTVAQDMVDAAIMAMLSVPNATYAMASELLGLTVGYIERRKKLLERENKK